MVSISSILCLNESIDSLFLPCHLKKPPPTYKHILASFRPFNNSPFLYLGGILGILWGLTDSLVPAVVLLNPVLLLPSLFTLSSDPRTKPVT